MPALRAIKSPSPSFNVSPLLVDITPLGIRIVGDAERVGGALLMSISIIIDDRRRNAGSSANLVARGLGGRRMVGESGIAVDGRSNDQLETRFNANA